MPSNTFAFCRFVVSNTDTMKQLLLLSIFFFYVTTLTAKPLKAGFDKQEYAELMYISARTGAASPNYYKHIPAPADHKLFYRSAPMGLDNLWELWIGPDKSLVISLRGTTQNATSWLANFYAGMVPATGQLQVEQEYLFDYKLASDERAAVHVGWLLSLAWLSRDILPKLDSFYTQGYRDLTIIGHSQGGAIAYLLMAELKHLQLAGRYADLRVKNYASAGPKPGNLYFAYDFEHLCGNWSYNVVNAADWVPETPVSIQTINDFNRTNPFKNARKLIRKQKFPANLALSYSFGRLSRSTRKAQRIYSHYLATMAGKMVSKSQKSFRRPRYLSSLNYVRTGNFIVLMPDSVYFRQYPESDTNVFVHHFHAPYLYLLERHKP